MQVNIEVVGDDEDDRASLMKFLRDAVMNYAPIMSEGYTKVGMLKKLEVTTGERSTQPNFYVCLGSDLTDEQIAHVTTAIDDFRRASALVLGSNRYHA